MSHEALDPHVGEHLSAADVNYVLRSHSDAGRPIASPADFAKALGIAPDRIAKTVLLKTRPHGTFVRVTCSTQRPITLHILAEHLGVSRLSVASVDELRDRLGQPPMGVSPFAATDVPVIVDAALLDETTVLVGGGTVGVEVELSPRCLVHATSATVLAVTAVRA